MKQVADNDEFLIQYLLGELSEPEQEAVEERYIGDREFYEKLLAAEDDLIDAFAQNALSESRKKEFEKRFLRIPDRRQRVEFASDWRTLLDRRQPARDKPRTSRWSFLDALRLDRPMALRFVAAMLVLMAGALLVTETLRLRNRLGQVESEKAALEGRQRELDRRAEDERRRNEELQAQLERERIEHEVASGADVPQPGASLVVAAVLIPGIIRGASGARPIVIPPGARYVSLKAAFKEGDYQSYGVVIKTVEGRSIWSRAGLSARTIARGKVVNVKVPTSVFDSSDYILTLTGVTDTDRSADVNEYAFTVVKAKS